jgi:glutamate--cysteine ligase
MTFLESFALENANKIQEWISNKMQGKTLPFYSSCDVRYSGYKVTQVDANCFPAGFNNLSLEGYKNAVQKYKLFFKQNGLKSILIYPEFHTRNFGYLKNVRTLKAIFEEAGAVVKLATNLETKFNIDLGVSDVKSISDELGVENSLDFDPIKKCKWFFQKKYKLGLGVEKFCFVADAIVLNNDLSSGMPEILDNISAPILPSPKMGWWRRKKTEHFLAYESVVQEFANEFKLDSWLFESYFEEASNIDIKNEDDMKIIENKSMLVLEKTLQKYKEYNIKSEPVIFLKSNFGTYGMGIHTLKNPEEVRDFNKNIRKKLATVKDGLANTSIIIQEGVETSLIKEEKAVEPVVYSANGDPIGMFFRLNLGANANLNAKGMELMHQYQITKEQEILFKMIASFANLAISKEVSNLI